MMGFGVWLLTGVAIGMILMAFLAISAYERGYNEGYFLRRPWRGELGVRRGALIVARKRERTLTAPTYVNAPPSSDHIHVGDGRSTAFP